MSLITIDQLLESIDLDFEPKFVTKDKNGMIKIFEHKPKKAGYYWLDENLLYSKAHVSFIKLAEFEGKDWTECIYEVQRKTTEKIEHIKTRKSIDCSDTPEAHIEKHRTFVEIWDKINELVDVVNELKSRTENMQPPYVHLYTCSDGAVFDNEDIAKSHEASLKSKQSMN